MEKEKVAIIFFLCFIVFNTFSQTFKKDSISIYQDFGSSNFCLQYSGNSLKLNKSQRVKLISFINKINVLDYGVRANLYIRLVPFNDYKMKIGVLRAKIISDYIVKNSTLERFKILIVERTDVEGEGQNLLCIESRIE
jgi:hypothetical protein